MILLMGAEKESDDLARLQKNQIQSANFILELIFNQIPKYRELMRISLLQFFKTFQVYK